MKNAQEGIHIDWLDVNFKAAVAFGILVVGFLLYYIAFLKGT